MKKHVNKNNIKRRIDFSITRIMTKICENKDTFRLIGEDFARCIKTVFRGIKVDKEYGEYRIDFIFENSDYHMIWTGKDPVTQWYTYGRKPQDPFRIHFSTVKVIHNKTGAEYEALEFILKHHRNIDQTTLSKLEVVEFMLI